VIEPLFVFVQRVEALEQDGQFGSAFLVEEGVPWI
jgi:hypothetical protein